MILMSVQAMTSTVYYIMCKTRSAKYLLSLTERGAAALHTSYYPPGTGGTIGTIHLLRNHFLWGGRGGGIKAPLMTMIMIIPPNKSCRRLHSYITSSIQGSLEDGW